ncbi:unnamed protein product [Closterium sp. NIES-54]
MLAGFHCELGHGDRPHLHGPCLCAPFSVALHGAALHLSTIPLQTSSRLAPSPMSSLISLSTIPWFDSRDVTYVILRHSRAATPTEVSWFPPLPSPSPALLLGLPLLRYVRPTQVAVDSWGASAGGAGAGGGGTRSGGTGVGGASLWGC